MNRSRQYDDLIAKLHEINSGITTRTIACAGGTIHIAYIKPIVNQEQLAETVIKPLMQFTGGATARPRTKKILDSVIHAADCRLETDLSRIEAYLLDGMTILLTSYDEHYAVINLKQVPHRAVSTPNVNYSIRGPKDSFVENLEVNLSLIRYRIKDPNLRIEIIPLGRRTKTSMAVIYIEDIARADVVDSIRRRLKRIDTDALWGTGDLQNFLSSSKHPIFPEFGIIERSDAACEALVEGKVVLLGDGGQIALLAPHTFSEAMIACDDRYDNKYFGLFSRVLRYMALFLTLCLSSVYVALVAYHPDALPGSYAISLAQMRQGVLFSAIFEVLIVEFISELMREALLRVPSKIGTAIGIVGAIIIGDAATSAGIFDALVLIIISTSLLASFAIPDYFSMHPVRILKFFMIGMTSILGFYGFVLAFCLILSHLVSIESCGVPYMAPFAPFNLYDFQRAMIFTRSTSKYRMQYMNLKDDKRAP